MGGALVPTRPARGISIGPALRLSAPLFVSSTSLLALGEMHLWMLGSLSVPDQVAIYGAVYRIVMLVSLPLTLVNRVIPPMVAELFTRQRKGVIERLLRTTASVIALPAMLMLVLLIVFGGDVLQLVYGGFFRSGAPVLAIMSAGQAINVWTGSPGVLLSMSDQQGKLMWASFCGGVIGLLITLSLVRDYGATGEQYVALFLRRLRLRRIARSARDKGSTMQRQDAVRAGGCTR